MPPRVPSMAGGWGGVPLGQGELGGAANSARAVRVPGQVTLGRKGTSVLEVSSVDLGEWQGEWPGSFETEGNLKIIFLWHHGARSHSFLTDVPLMMFCSDDY